MTDPKSKSRLKLLLGLLVLAAVVAYMSWRAIPRPSYPEPVDLSVAGYYPVPHLNETTADYPVWVLRPEPSGAPSWSDYLAEIVRGEGFSVLLAPCPSEGSSLPSSLRAVVLRPGCSSETYEVLERFTHSGGLLIGSGVAASSPEYLNLFGVQEVTSGSPQHRPGLVGRNKRSALRQRDRSTYTPQIESIDSISHAIERPAAPGRLTPEARLEPTTSETQLERPWRAPDGALMGLLFRRSLGKGTAWLWTADLAKSTALARQGDPARAGMATLLPHPCPAELLQGQVEPDQYQTPFVDLWAHDLSGQLSSGVAPVPAFWPFPTATPSTILWTADQDYADDEFVQFELDRVEDAGGEMTLYLTANSRRKASDPADAVDHGSPQPEKVAEWSARHHGISIHPNANGLPRDPKVLEATLRSSLEAQIQRFGIMPRTIRHHFVFWWGYMDTARALSELGILMDLNYSSIYPGYSGHGYLSGTGMPLPFVDVDGTVLPIFQQPTQIEDSLLVGDYDFSARLSEKEALKRASALIRGAPNFGTAITINIHPLYAVKMPGLMDGLLLEAQKLKIPILSAERWLELVQRRYASRLHGLRLEGDALEFSAEISEGRQWLRLPDGAKGPCRRIEVDGHRVEGVHLDKPESLRGTLFPLDAGKHRIRGTWIGK